MISYGSQPSGTEMSNLRRSHQLGEGQLIGAEMPCVRHPSRLVYESQGSNAEMPMRYRSQGEGQLSTTGMSGVVRPSPPVYGSQSHGTGMSHLVRSQGEGQPIYTGMSCVVRPSPPVYGSLCYHAAMLMSDRSHLFTRGQQNRAAMLMSDRLSREGAPEPRRNAL